MSPADPEESDEAAPSLDPYAADLRLEGLRGRPASQTAQVREVLDFVEENGVPDRSGLMIIGLHLSFISVAEEVLARLGEESLSDAVDSLERYESEAGKTVRTLTFKKVQDRSGASKDVGIRTAYNAVLEVVRGQLRRFDYPSSAPHATQDWSTHTERIDAIFAMSPAERRAVADGLWTQLMELPEHERRTLVRTVRHPFASVLEKFRPKGAKSGASLQGIAYGFMRADAPTLNFQTRRVRAGGRREGRVGDIDGYYGPDVAQAVEVKDYELRDFADLDDFLGNLADWPDAVAIVICDAVTDEVVAEAATHDITVITRDQLVAAVQLWPHQKQMEAVRATIEYFVHTEKDDALIRSFAEFLDAEGIGLGLKAQADAQEEIAALAGDDDA